MHWIYNGQSHTTKECCICGDLVKKSPAIRTFTYSGKVLGIDLGVVKLVTIGNNFGGVPIIVKGGVARSGNQFYNKERVKLQSIYESHGLKTGKKIEVLTHKRNSRIKDTVHKLSRANRLCSGGESGKKLS